MSTTQDRINAALGLTSGTSAGSDAPKPAVASGGASAPSTAPVAGPATNPGGGFSVWAQDALTRGASDVAQGLRDAPGAIVRGAEGAANEVSNKVNKFSDWLGTHLPAPAPSDGTTLTPEARQAQVQAQADANKGTAAFATWHQEEVKKAAGQQTLIPDALTPTPSDSNTGQFIEQATQFGVGLVGAGKLFDGLGIASEAPGAIGKVLSAAKGAIAQTSVFDAYQSKLSNLVQSNPSLANPVTKFLASNPDDNEAVAMLKQGIEGSVTGLAQDSLVEGLKILKASRLFTDAVDPAAKLAAKTALGDQITASDKILTDAKKNVKFTVEPTPEGQFTIKTNLTADQEAAVTASTTNSSATGIRVNVAKALGVGGKPSIMQEIAADDPLIQNHATQLTQAISEAAPNTVPLTRGTSLPADSEILAKARSGEPFTLPLSSFSEDPNIANSFGNGAAAESHDSKVIFHLEPGSAQAVNATGEISAYPFEKEWLTAGDFKASSVTTDADGTTHVALSQVPSEATSAEVNQYPRTFGTQAEAESEAGWLNTKDIEAKKAQVPGELTPDQKNLTIQLAKTNDPDQIKALLQSSTFNYLKVNGQEDAKKWISALTTTMKPEIDAARGGAQVTHQDLFNQIQDMFPDGDPHAIMSALGETFKSANDMSAHLNAGRALMYTFGQQVSKLSALADGDPTSAGRMLDLGDALDSLFTVTATVKKAVTNVARTLESLKTDPADIMTDTERNLAPNAGASTSALNTAISQDGPQSVAARKVLASLQGMTLEDMRVLARRLRVADGDPTSILAMLKSTPRELPPLESFARQADEHGLRGTIQYAGRVAPRAIAIHNEYWMNALLSGPKTIAVNALSNTTNAFIRPIEYFNAGVIASDPKMKEKGWDLMTGNFANLKDSWNMGRRALLTGEQGLDAGSIAKSESAQAQIGGYVGQLIRTPSRILMASDEFFKQMNYRSNIRAQALAEARTMPNLDAAGVAQYVQQAMDVAFTPDGKGVNKAAMEYARDTTFTKPLDPSGVASKLQGITNAHPLAKVILPFVQTPTNILNWTWERTPLLRNFNSDVRADLAAGGARAAMAQSKLGTGMAVWSTAAGLAATGAITGKGPDNPELRKQWRDAGNEPYSISIGGKQFAYNRMDPLLMPFGIVADLVHSSGETKDEDMKDMALGFASSMAANFSSKTYLAGIANAMDTLTSGQESRMSTFLNNQAGSYVPNALNAVNPDGSMREVRGVVDSLMSKMPGFSELLPPRRNIVGDVIMKPPGDVNRAINPFTMMNGVKPDVLSELLSIGTALPMPKKDIHGVDITSMDYGKAPGNLSPYDRMLQIVGNNKVNGSTLRETLTKTVASDEWKALPDDATVKADFASKIIQKYRMVAETQIQKEFPKLKTAVDQAILSKNAAKTQGQAGIDRIKAMFASSPTATPQSQQ